MSLPNINPPGPGGPLVASMNAMNALTQSSAKARYAPWTEYANALSHMSYARMLPYQIQATMLSNPILLQSLSKNPGAVKNMMENMAKQSQNMSSGDLGMGMPQPGQGMNNPLSQLGGFASDGVNWLRKKLGMDSSPQQGMQQPSIQGGGMPMPQGPMQGGGAVMNPNDPSASGSEGTQTPQQVGQTANAAVNNVDQNGNSSSLISSDPVQQAINNATGKYKQSPFANGSTVIDNNGNVKFIPTERSKGMLLNQVYSGERLMPQLKDLSTAAAPFLDAKGNAKLFYHQLNNFIGGGQSNLPSEYGQYQSLLETAPESLLKVYGLNVTDKAVESMRKAIKPAFGENSKKYEQRILSQISKLRKEQIEPGRTTLREGMEIAPSKPEYNMDISTNPEEIAKAKSNVGQTPGRKKWNEHTRRLE